MHLLVLQGTDLTWRERYESADSVFQIVEREFPNHPAGCLYQAGVLLAKAMDNEMELDISRFDSLIDRGIERAEAMLNSKAERAWAYFFLGTAYGSDSYARVYRGDWFGGTRKGFSSVSAFKDATRLDSMITDAYGGIGAFYYWRSRKTESFNWLPFVGDDREEAFTLLQKSVDFGLYNKYTALNMLVTICIDAGMYEKAILCSMEGLRQYPENRSLLWGLATASQKSGKWSDASGAYRRLLVLIERSKGNNHYNEIVCMLNLAMVEAELGKAAEARRILTSVLQYRESDFPVHLQTRAKDKLGKAATLISDLDRRQPPAGK